MAEPAELIPIAVVLAAFLLLLRLREAHPLKRGLAILATTSLIALSLMHPNLKVALAAIVAASLFALSPIALSDFDEAKERKIRSLLSYQFLSYIFLIFAFFMLSNAPDKHFIVWLLALSIVFRLGLSFSSRSLVDILLLMPGSQRALFYLSSFAFSFFVTERLLKTLLAPNEQLLFGAIFIIPLGISIWNAFKASSARERLLYLSQSIVLLPLATSIFSVPFVAVTILAQSNAATKALANADRFEIDVKIFETTLALFHRISRFCRRVLGPVIIEWIVLRIPTGVLVLVRLASRLISYASTPRVLATSLLVSFIMLVYILRL